jgi:hypothetical protein
LFFTYYRVVPTGQMGVLKRCLRLIAGLHDFEVHLINFGPLPEHDSLWDEVKFRIQIHSPLEDNLGLALADLMRQLNPAVVVFGETPLRGNMWLSHRVAATLRIPQVSIENYYGPFVETYLPAQWPDIDRWLLLGLMPSAQPTLRAGRIDVVPPLVTFPSCSPTRDRICVLGYDEATLISATRLLKAWPEQKVDYIIAPEWRSILGPDANGRIMELPSDMILCDCLARAKLVIGKAGFQQMVEAISLGSPIICRICGGGVTGELVPNYLQPLVRFIHDDEEIPAMLRVLPEWLAAMPPIPWADNTTRLPNPVAHAVATLAEILSGPFEKVAEPEPANEEWPFGSGTKTLQHLLRLMERKDWVPLDTALRSTSISVQGTQLSSSEFCRELRSLLRQVADVKAVLLARISGGAYGCCAMAFYPDSWQEQEIEFEVRLGFGSAQ